MKAIKQLVQKWWFWLIVLGLGLLLIYGPKLAEYQLSGDDLFLIDNAPVSWSSFGAKWVDFQGQYRPLPHSLFIFYRWLTPQTSIILAINFALMLAVAALIFANLNRFIKPWWSMILAGAVLLSPIFYYHFFAIAALNNTLMLIFLLLLVGLVDFKKAKSIDWSAGSKIALAVGLLLLSIFSKETFLVNALVVIVVFWQNLNRKKFYWVTGVTILGLMIYLTVHFSAYQAGGESDYALGNSLTGGVRMVLDMTAWLIAYPRGWQYAAPLPKTGLTYLTTLISLVALGLIFIPVKDLIKKWQQQLLFLLALGLSIGPFLIVDRALVFYLDVAILILVFWLVINHYQWSKQNWAQVFYGVMALSLVMQFGLYYSQWHQHSFVANANETIHHYEQTLRSNEWEKYYQICVINNSRGGWATKNGEAARILLNYQGKIVNTENDSLPAECFSAESLILRNDGWQFELIEPLKLSDGGADEALTDQSMIEIVGSETIDNE